MDRFIYYNKKIVNKLILSKFVYSSENQKVVMDRVVVAPLTPQRDSEIVAFGVASFFGTCPSFVNPPHPREQIRVLRNLWLTAHKKKNFTFLNLLVNKVLPFQLANEMYAFTTLSPDGALTWIIRGCSFSNEINYVFFKYPMQQNTFDLIVQLKAKKTSLIELLYYGRLFQLPITLRSTFDNELST